MSMTSQNWQLVEAEQDSAKPKKGTDLMAYLAVLMILASIMALMTIFCAIGSTPDHLPDRGHAPSTTLSPTD
jgi:hypothetical protein